MLYLNFYNTFFRSTKSRIYRSWLKYFIYEANSNNELRIISFSKMASRPPITTHVLDTANGKPAANLPIALFSTTTPETRSSDLSISTWNLIGSGKTNEDGRCAVMNAAHVLLPGTYKMHFDTASYFRENNSKGFYPYAEVRARVLLLSNGIGCFRSGGCKISLPYSIASEPFWVLDLPRELTEIIKDFF